jgi:ribosomal-protein-alanine N-acetyltransferase
MQARHIEALAEIEKLCFSKPWSYNSLAEELSNPLAVFYVAEIDGETAAYAGMHHIIDEGYITNIAVHPNFRKKGLATALVRLLDSYAKNNGLSMLTLEVRQKNSPAIKIYSKAGFKQEGIRRDFYEAPKEDALILTKRY